MEPKPLNLWIPTLAPGSRLILIFSFVPIPLTWHYFRSYFLTIYSIVPLLSKISSSLLWHIIPVSESAVSRPPPVCVTQCRDYIRLRWRCLASYFSLVLCCWLLQFWCQIIISAAPGRVLEVWLHVSWYLWKTLWSMSARLLTFWYRWYWFYLVQPAGCIHY